jgi:hypothetical protein
MASMRDYYMAIVPVVKQRIRAERLIRERPAANRGLVPEINRFANRYGHLRASWP